MERIILAIVTVVVLFAMFGMILTGAHNIQVEQQRDPLLAISTDKVTLSKDLWQDDPNSVLTIVGYELGVATGENIYASSYAPVRQLTLVGHSDSTHVTVTYEVEGLKQFTGLGPLVGLSPMLIFIGAIGAIVLGLFFAFKGRFGGG